MTAGRGIFVTGTDTDIGKTVVMAGLLRRLRREGVDVMPMKPVQTGAVHDNDKGEPDDAGGLRAPDLDFCLKAADLQPPPEQYKLLAPYLYKPACSPHLAGRMADAYPAIDRIRSAACQLAENHDAVLAEGAGGVLVPLDEDTLMPALMHKLGFPVILVARGGLGTINHTLLSLTALRRAQLDVLGVILVDRQEPRPDAAFIRRDNPHVIARFGQTRILGEIPCLPGIGDADHASPLWDDFDKGLQHFSIIKDALTP